VIGNWERVLLARHGQTEWNVVGRRQGQLDAPLTALGIEQARRHAVVVAADGADRVFTSPQGRATATARLIAEALDLSIVVVDELAEIHHGEFAGLTDTEIEARFPAEWWDRTEDKYEWRFPGGESYADADPRALLALRKIATDPARRPLIITHEMVSRLLLRHLLGLTPHEALTRRHPHDVVFRIGPDGVVSSLA
jgi:broad specificity phosphatase PhoE